MGMLDDVVGAGVVLGLTYGGVKLAQSVFDKNRKRRSKSRKGNGNCFNVPTNRKIKMYIDR